MRKLKCPQCKISNLYLKNEKGERRLVNVMDDHSVVASKNGETTQGYDTEEIFCLGCSWSGGTRKLVK